MSLRKAFRGASRQRAMRCIAILFLLYTAIDLADPQMCSEEAISLTTAQVSVARDSFKPTAVAISADDDSSRNQPAKHESQDEDCFCCCAHIVPGIPFVTPNVLELKSAFQMQIVTAAPPSELETLYHPPRFS